MKRNVKIWQLVSNSWRTSWKAAALTLTAAQIRTAELWKEKHQVTWQPVYVISYFKRKSVTILGCTLAFEVSKKFMIDFFLKLICFDIHGVWSD